jgi:hypothetical protein
MGVCIWRIRFRRRCPRRLSDMAEWKLSAHGAAALQHSGHLPELNEQLEKAAESR